MLPIPLGDYGQILYWKSPLSIENRGDTTTITNNSYLNFWDEAWWFLSLRVFGLLSSSLLASSGRCSDTTWSRELNQTIYTVYYGERARQQITLPRFFSNTHRFRSSVYRKPTFTVQYLNFNFHHQYTVKKGIVRCLQHRAKTISSDTDAYQEKISLRHNLHRNNYPERITLAPRNLDRKIEDNTRKLTTVCLPYVKGVAERIQKICRPYDIRTVFTSGSTLRRYLFRVKPLTEFHVIKNCVYSIPYSCGKIYKDEIGHPLKLRLEEHRKAVVRGEIEKLGMADHIWKEKGNHLPLWDKVEIIDRTEHWRTRHLKESAHMLGYNDLLNRQSMDLDTIWEPIIKKARWKKSEYEYR